MEIEQKEVKHWVIKFANNESIDLHLVSSSITNKYHIISDFLKRVSKFHGNQFDEWLFDFLSSCKDEQKRAEIVSSNIEVIKNYTDTYLDSLQIDFSQFVNKSKAKKNSILFTDQELEDIVRLSCYLKVYSLIFNSENFKLGPKLHREIYNKFSQKLIDSEIASKIFDVVKSKTFRYNLSDKFMWDYIKTIQCKDIGIHIIEIFNFIMNNIIIMCEETKNPITYFVGVIDESIKWFLRSVYKGAIVYDDEIATEDIHRIHVNNLKSYSFNDTLGRLKAIAFEKIYEQLEQENSLVLNDKTDQYVIDFNNRLSSIEFISPLAPSLTYPLLSEMTEIPYVHFKTISPEHAAVLSYYLNRLLEKVFKTDFKNLFVLLDYFPMSNPSVTTTYKIKAIHEFLNIQNQIKSFYGFNTKIFPHRVLCHFIGRTSRINFRHLLSGKNISGIPLSKIENDMIHFYSLYFAGKLTDKIHKLTMLMHEDF